MSSAWAALGLALAATVWWDAPAPTREQIEADRAACKRKCAASADDETDRTTCELNCDTKADNRLEGPSITHWKTEKRMGGPPPGVPVGHPDDPTRIETMTVTKTTIREPAPSEPEPKAMHAASRTVPAGRAGWRARVPLAFCQSQCTATKAVDTQRWACKLACLHRHPTQSPANAGGAHVAAPMGDTSTSRSTSTSTSTPTPTPTSTSCEQQCASEPAGDDRETCIATCEYRGEQSRTEIKGTRRIGADGAKANTTACENTCAQQASACTQACAGTGSDVTTCRLQCEQRQTSCARKCK